MATDASSPVEFFKKNAAAVSAKTVEVENLAGAMAYALDICARKEACELLFTGCGKNLSLNAANLCERATKKMIAAPGLNPEDFAALEKQARKKGFTVIREGMRGYLSGIDLGFVVADMGIAETGTCIVASASEDVRLSTMVCEVSVIALPKSAIVNSLYDTEEYLNKTLQQDAMYTAYITGPSRTADIERVLTLGVHGPLELHVALMEG
jgi:L-lactate dehydrogenase complex protein LldG